MENQKPGTFFGRNPVLVYLLVQTSIAMIAAFGFDMSGEQMASIMAFVNVVIALVANTQVVPISVAQAQINQALMTPVPEQPKTEEQK